ncbi:serine racemase-like [Telopea speciosissima]|uniref:serine racemase-like n=1 Tax=Telopea speciosissima TaxID=54955 RepID=UPI001CC53F60|nr:serine racemase-like [Telopea speciosissima]
MLMIAVDSVNYDDVAFFSGQGTIALELLEQIPHLDTVIVPISGGGLISGVALAAEVINPAILFNLSKRPEFAKLPGLLICSCSNACVSVYSSTLFYSCRPVVWDLVDDIIVVEDKEIIEAMRLCYEILKVAVEPSGAIGLAAVLSEGFRENPAWKDCKDIGIILSGGNVDLNLSLLQRRELALRTRTHSLTPVFIYIGEEYDESTYEVRSIDYTTKTILARDRRFTRDWHSDNDKCNALFNNYTMPPIFRYLSAQVLTANLTLRVCKHHPEVNDDDSHHVGVLPRKEVCKVEVIH